VKYDEPTFDLKILIRPSENKTITLLFLDLALLNFASSMLAIIIHVEMKHFWLKTKEICLFFTTKYR